MYLLIHAMTRVWIFTRGIHWTENVGSRDHTYRPGCMDYIVNFSTSGHGFEDSSVKVLHEGIWFLRINVAYSDHQNFLLKACYTFWSHLNLDSWMIQLYWQAHTQDFHRWPGELLKANWDSHLSNSLLSLLCSGPWTHSSSLSLLHCTKEPAG